MGKHERGREVTLFVYQKRGTVERQVFRMRGDTFYRDEPVRKALSIGGGGKGYFRAYKQWERLENAVAGKKEECDEGPCPQHG